MAPGTRVLPTHPNRLFAAERGRGAGFVGNTGSGVRGDSTVLKPLKPLRLVVCMRGGGWPPPAPPRVPCGKPMAMRISDYLSINLKQISSALIITLLAQCLAI